MEADRLGRQLIQPSEIATGDKVVARVSPLEVAREDDEVRWRKALGQVKLELDALAKLQQTTARRALGLRG
jgi:hypothetical protein